MNNILTQFLNFFRVLPLSKKISMLFVLALVVSAFMVMYFWANEEDYQVLYSNLSLSDGGAVIAKLKEKNIPFQVEANGTIVKVPADKVHEIRLVLAGENLPNGGGVGYEIFDHSDFRTTKFVEELNYRRALEGELARTINQFDEVKASKVFIVIPKESLFVEESKPASASIQLDLRSSLPPAKLAAIVHLIASAVEGLEAEQVTVVDTKGRLIFKGDSKENAGYFLSSTQLDYKWKVEQAIKDNIQSMLEGIVGTGKAIVRVTADIDFNKVTLQEEEYDPAATAIRSQRGIEEASQSTERTVVADETLISERSGIVPAGTEPKNSKTRKDISTNYEVNKITRTILKSAGSIKRLSVAAVIDGLYEMKEAGDGTLKRSYIPRSADELRKFEDVVKKAMGYSDDREDQISVDSIAFSDSLAFTPDTEMPAEEGTLLKYVDKYKKTIMNFVLVLLVFFTIVRPLLKSMKTIKDVPLLQSAGMQTSLPEQMPEGMQDMRRPHPKDRIIEMSKSNPDKAQQLIKGWISE